MSHSSIYTPEPNMTLLTFRSPKITYYGPHQCENCGIQICKMGREFGGNTFTYPTGPIYPNTEWHPHVCNPRLVEEHRSITVARAYTELPAESPAEMPVAS